MEKYMINQETLITAAKWVAMILVTGFIAQFGRKFAEYLIKRFRKKESPVKSIHADNIPQVDENSATGSNAAFVEIPGTDERGKLKKKQEKETSKLEKKKQKALIKNDKK